MWELIQAVTSIKEALEDCEWPIRLWYKRLHSFPVYSAHGLKLIILCTTSNVRYGMDSQNPVTYY